MLASNQASHPVNLVRPLAELEPGSKVSPTRLRISISTWDHQGLDVARPHLQDGRNGRCHQNPVAGAKTLHMPDELNPHPCQAAREMRMNGAL